jgi:hypothetical protein
MPIIRSTLKIKLSNALIIPLCAIGTATATKDVLLDVVSYLGSHDIDCCHSSTTGCECSHKVHEEYSDRRHYSSSFLRSPRKPATAPFNPSTPI